MKNQVLELLGGALLGAIMVGIGVGAGLIASPIAKLFGLSPIGVFVIIIVLVVIGFAAAEEAYGKKKDRPN